jgi:hypothetical protein
MVIPHISLKFNKGLKELKDRQMNTKTDPIRDT